MQAMLMTMFLVSLALMILLVAFFKRNTSIYYTLLFASIVVQNLGYVQLASAQTLEAAVYANQVVYLASSFMPFFAFMCIADLCHVEPGKLFKTVCMSISGFIFVGVSTIGINSLYYKDVNIVVTDSFTYLQREYGPLHAVYPLYLVAMSVCALGIIIRSFRHRRMISYITSSVLTVIMVFTVFLYILEKAVHSPVELVPIGYVVMQIGILILLSRISLYDITTVSGKSITESMEYGFVVCSGRGRFAGADKAARLWFPELGDLLIDYKITRTDTEFLDQLCRWSDSDKDETRCFHLADGKVIKAKHAVIGKFSSQKIHCVYLSDDTEQHKYMHLIEQFNEKLEAQVTEKTDRLREVQNDIIISMASIVENRDNNTGGHIKRTSDIVKIFVEHLIKSGYFTEIDEKTADYIVKAAPLHDFGKIAIPDVILNKPGKFTEEEYEQMKQHSAKGAVIVERILQNSDDEAFKKIAVNVAHYHHEKWDGTGYPTGLKTSKIPVEARIMALADVFDALVSKRVYKESFNYDRAFYIIEDSCGTHFDPALCKAFLQCRPKLEALYNSYTD